MVQSNSTQTKRQCPWHILVITNRKWFPASLPVSMTVTVVKLLAGLMTNVTGHTKLKLRTCSSRRNSQNLSLRNSAIQVRIMISRIVYNECTSFFLCAVGKYVSIHPIFTFRFSRLWTKCWPRWCRGKWIWLQIFILFIWISNNGNTNTHYELWGWCDGIRVNVFSLQLHMLS